MTPGALFSALLRRSRPHAAAALHANPRPFSSRPSMSDLLSADQQPPAAAPEDDLKSRIFRLRFPKRSATAALEKWVSEGRTVTAPELRRITRDLRRSQRYKHALEILEWMKTHQEFELLDGDYAMRIDLITKVFGANASEEFFEGLPSSAKSCEVYTSLLHSYAGAKMVEKAEKLFEKIKKLNFSLTALTFNEMMTLYMSVGQLDKVPLIVEELKQMDVSLDLFTYNLWISACAATQDINAVTRILGEMARDQNSNEGWIRYMKLVDIYFTAGHLVNSDIPLAEMEKGISQREWITYDFLIILHAGLGNREKISEIWKSLRKTSQKMTSRNYICVLSSYLVLGQLKEAGEIIDEWMQSKALDFNASACHRLVDALVKASLMDTAQSFCGLMLQKNCELD